MFTDCLTKWTKSRSSFKMYENCFGGKQTGLLKVGQKVEWKIDNKGQKMNKKGQKSVDKLSKCNNWVQNG